MKRMLLILLGLFLFSVSGAGETTVDKYLNAVEIGKPIEYENLTLFPLKSKKSLSIQSYVTLDQATDKGWIKIKERGTGEVNYVEVKNNGKKMVFLMTGEIISGAKQDRMINHDILLPANSGWIQVPVYCVEHGRWTQVTPEFKSEKLIVPNALRQKAKLSESQAEVWDEISASQTRMGIASGTGTVRANYEDAEIKKKLDEYVKKFEKVPALSSSTIGVVVTTGDRIICFDMFANNGLLKKLWKKLVKSYAMDALEGEKGNLSKEDIKKFLESLKHADYISTGTPGLGSLIKVESDFGKGSALLYKSAVVHMDFFPNQGFIDQEEELDLQFRRDQRLDE